MTDETTKVLAEYITKNIIKRSKYPLESNTKLVTSGLIDSLSIVDLVFFIEERFGVKIKPAELNAQTFDTLGDLVSLVEARQKTGERRQ